MDRLKAMETFICVARHKSFSRAARELGISRALVTSRLQALEDHLGARLLHRTTRSLKLTEIGEGYSRTCLRILDEIDSEERTLRGLQYEARGELRVTMPKSFGPLHMGPACAAFVERFPDIRLVLIVEDTLFHTLSSISEHYDVAVRLAPSADSSLVIRKLSTVEWRLCAAPSYLERHGIPATPQELSGHNCLTHLTLDHDRFWRFEGKRRPIAVKVQGNYSANSVITLCDAALAGLGIAMLPTYCAARHLRDGALLPVLARWKVPEQPIYAAYPFGKVPPQKVQLFIDFLADWFRRPPWKAGRPGSGQRAGA